MKYFELQVNDGPDGEIYCRGCYVASFGLAGYGYGQGAGTLISVRFRIN